MEEKRRTRYICCFVALAILAAILMVANVFSGSARMSLSQVWSILLTGEGENAAVVWNIRLPRLLAVFFLGGALSLSGFLLQTFFGNPIAGPFVLGISSGAKLVVALTMIFSLANGIVTNSLILVIAAFIGAMLSMGAILFVSRRLKSMALLVVCGVMIGYICSAITDILVAFASDSDIVNLHNWSRGSFAGMNWNGVFTSIIVVCIGLVFSFLISKPMGAYQLGEAYAKSVGVKTNRFRIQLILLSSVLSACVTAFAGPISFVGIAVPHLMKSFFKTAKPILMVPACFLGGGAFCLLCDLIARTVFAPTELSISSVTAVFGVPVVIWMLLSRQKKKEQEI